MVVTMIRIDGGGNGDGDGGDDAEQLILTAFTIMAENAGASLLWPCWVGEQPSE